MNNREVYTKFLLYMLKKYEIYEKEHIVKDIFFLYQWEFATEKRLKHIENRIINNPEIKPFVRKLKLKKLNELR